MRYANKLQGLRNGEKKNCAERMNNMQLETETEYKKKKKTENDLTPFMFCSMRAKLADGGVVRGGGEGLSADYRSTCAHNNIISYCNACARVRM